MTRRRSHSASAPSGRLTEVISTVAAQNKVVVELSAGTESDVLGLSRALRLARETSGRMEAIDEDILVRRKTLCCSK